MKAINLIEELLSQHPHIVISSRLTFKNIIQFLPIKQTGLPYKIRCNKDEVLFISQKLNIKNDRKFGPFLIEYTLLNVDLKHPKSIDMIHEFLKQLR